MSPHGRRDLTTESDAKLLEHSSAARGTPTMLLCNKAWSQLTLALERARMQNASRAP
jgi:hypothetical protein